MDGATKEQVSETLERLKERYRPFEVSQTSVGVPTTVFDRVARGGHLDAAVRVHNDDGDLLVTRRDDGEGMCPPSVRVRSDSPESLDGELRAAFEDETGVDCTIRDLVEVAIVTVYDQSDEDRQPVYVLEAHFDAEYEAGPVRGDRFSWCPASDAVELSY